MNIFARNSNKRITALRGRILELIYWAAMDGSHNPDDPYVVSAGILTTSLEQLGELPGTQDLHAAVRYLEEKQYLDAEFLKDGTGNLFSVRLKPSGIDLYEGNAEDKGVYIRARR